MLCFILELAGVAYLLNHSTLWSDITWWLQARFLELINNSDIDPQEARILRIIQEEVRRLISMSVQNVIFMSIDRLAAADLTVRLTISELTNLCQTNAVISSPATNTSMVVTSRCHATYRSTRDG